MDPVITLNGLTKTYASGLVALQPIDLTIERGEIFALLGPNGAGKTTLISMVCGIVTPTSGQALINGHDVVRDYRAARASVGLVPQELANETFETPWASTRYSRGLFGYPPDPAHLERLLRDLSLWDKAHDKVQTLSGGMKRRVLIAKALAHEPQILFLDEPTAGVSPIVMDELFDRIIEVARTGISILMVEQNARQALNIADKGFVLVIGENRHTDSGQALLEDPEVRRSFLGG